MGTVMSVMINYSESKYSKYNYSKKKYNRKNIYNNNSDNIYMGNVLSKMKKTMQESLSIMKQKIRKDNRAEQIYQEIHQKDHTIDFQHNIII